MGTVLIDGVEVEIGDDERLNGIQAAQRADKEVPHYCWHPGLSVVASCRMCLVETGRRDKETGDISMVPKLVPACQTPATDGTVFITDSEKVRAARALVEEDLLIRHPIDCPICDKAGECHLQDYHFEHGREERRADLQPFTSRRRSLGDTVTLFVDRCVMCSRCVRFCRETAGTSELMVVNRGTHEEIDVFPGFPLDNKMSGNVVDLCPVGALGDKDFLYQQRVWFMKGHDHVCGGCSAGCSIRVDENQDRIYRIKPRENQQVNQWWICDEGRYDWHYIHDGNRVAGPQRQADDQAVEWEAILDDMDTDLRRQERIAAVLSPFQTVEEAYLLAQYVRSIDAEALLGVGPIPVSGEDESFAQNFTIRAEKCPNRKGVEHVVAGLQGELLNWEAFQEKLEADDSIQAIWVVGGAPLGSECFSDETGACLRRRRTLIVQELFPSPLWNSADYQLPTPAFAERAGSFVNCDHRLQSVDWAIRPPAGVYTDGQLYWRLLNRTGLFQADVVRRELAADIGYFTLAAEEIPLDGVCLTLNHLATESTMVDSA
ncbi:MAG TPA: ferredoxin [Planctomycetaceae bacterium]|nr:ferredoxin [Planctomycetaceae bacterium]